MGVAKRSGARRRGFTIAEVLVASAISALVLTVLLYLFGQSRASIATSQDKLSVLHEGRMLLEWLKRDARAFRADPDHPAAGPRIAPDGLEFPVESSTGDGARVAYAFAAREGSVTRTAGDGGTLVFGGGAVRVRAFSVTFESRTAGVTVSRRLRVKIRLSDAEDEPRSRLELETTVVPPAL